MDDWGWAEVGRGNYRRMGLPQHSRQEAIQWEFHTSHALSRPASPTYAPSTFPHPRSPRLTHPPTHPPQLRLSHRPPRRLSPAPFLFCVQLMVPCSPPIAMVSSWAAPYPVVGLSAQELIARFEEEQGPAPDNVAAFFRVFSE